VAGCPEDKPFLDSEPLPTVEEILAHGDALIDEGLAVFVLSGSKKPLKNCDRCDTECTTPEDKEACPHPRCHAFYGATKDKDRFRAMLGGRSDRCLAVRTGAVSGVMIADYDGPQGIETMRRHIAEGILPKTRTVRTGNGYHAYLAHPGGYVISGAGKLGIKADSKADLAYVVAPPSLHKSGRRYTWVDPDVPIAQAHADMVAQLRPPVIEAPKPVTFDGKHSHRAHKRLVGLVNQVLNAEEGNGNNSLFWSACKAGELVRDGDITSHQAHTALYDAAMAIGINPGDAGREPHRGTIGSGLKRGMRS
jgi:hypothetical protein